MFLKDYGEQFRSIIMYANLKVNGSMYDSLTTRKLLSEQPAIIFGERARNIISVCANKISVVTSKAALAEKEEILFRFATFAIMPRLPDEAHTHIVQSTLV